jgi:hypothetical protein
VTKEPDLVRVQLCSVACLSKVVYRLRDGECSCCAIGIIVAHKPW